MLLLVAGTACAGGLLWHAGCVGVVVLRNAFLVVAMVLVVRLDIFPWYLLLQVPQQADVVRVSKLQ